MWIIYFQWIYLSMVFDDNTVAHQKAVLARFEEVDRRFKVMSDIPAVIIISQHMNKAIFGLHDLHG